MSLNVPKPERKWQKMKKGAILRSKILLLFFFLMSQHKIHIYNFYWRPQVFLHEHASSAHGRINKSMTSARHFQMLQWITGFLHTSHFIIPYFSHMKIPNFPHRSFESGLYAMTLEYYILVLQLIQKKF